MLFTGKFTNFQKNTSRSRAFFQMRFLFAQLALLIAVDCLNISHVMAGATSFVEPTDWTVGDLDSTFQEWNSATTAYTLSGNLPSGSNVNPSLTSTADMGTALPGFVAGSGSFYAISDSYQVDANVFNHGGSSGSGGPYPAGYGTRVLVQASATLNPDFNEGVFANLLQIVQHDGSPITGGENSSLLQTTELFIGQVLTSFGLVDQQELLFEFWLPDYTGDFQVQVPTQIHSSFNHLRIDSLITAPPVIDPDFDESGVVDGMDFLIWQQDTAAHGQAAGLDAWKEAFGAPMEGSLLATTPLPEPSSMTLLMFAAFCGFRSRVRHCQ